MAENTIDTLQLEIRSNAGESASNLDKLAASLKKLKESLEGMDTGLGNVSEKIKEFSSSASGLNPAVKSLRALTKIEFSKLQISGDFSSFSALAKGMSDIADSATKLSVLSGSDINRTIRSLERMAGIDFSKLSSLRSLSGLDFSSIADLGSAFSGLASTLAGADKVSAGTRNIFQALSQLAASSGSMSSVIANLPKLTSKIYDFITEMHMAPSVESGTSTIISALSSLSNAGNKAKETAKALPDLTKEVKDFLKEMSSVTSIDNSVIRAVEALSRLSSSGSRAGTSMNGLNGHVKRVSGSMLKLSGSTGKALKNIKSFAKQLAGAMGIYASIYGVIRGIQKSMDISSDLVEVQNVVDKTFGDMAYKVEELSKTSIQDFGMSELTAKQISSRFQSMGVAMGFTQDKMSDMSIQLTELAADMASFYNVEQESVAESLESIFTGQTRPLRTYGMDLTQATLQEWAMKQGIDANMKSMSQMEKTMLRFQYVTAQTKGIVGDFKDTQMTWANQTRILAQSFEQLGSIVGGVLVNAIKPLVIGLNSALQHVISFARTVSDSLGKIFGWTYEESSGGIAGDFEDAAESADDIADSTGDAAKNVDKMVKGARAFDELKILSFDDGDSGKGSSGNGGGGSGDLSSLTGALGEWKPKESILKQFESEIDSLYKLGKYIGDALKDTLDGINWDSVYKKARKFGKGLADFLNGLISPGLFASLGKTIAKSLNTAFHFLDSFGETFDFKNFGLSLAYGLNSALKNIDWKTAISASRNIGTGIALAINQFIRNTDFDMIGSTVANALNTAINFALNLGVTLDFKGIGNSIANSINGFFRTFSFTGLASAFNIWASGILDALIRAISKTDWDLIGKKIGTFIEEIKVGKIFGKFGISIWKALNSALETYSGMFKKAPVESAILGLVGVTKLLKTTNVQKFITSIKKGITVTTNFAKALGGSSASLRLLRTRFPKVAKAALVLRDSFDMLKSGITSGHVFTGLSDALKKIRDNLSGTQKLAITAAAGFAEFNAVSDIFEDLTLKNEKFIDRLPEIGVKAGLAAAAMYTALGPAGAAVAGVTFVIGAINGTNDALDKIHAENVGNAINEALSNPGGTPISDLTDAVSKAITGIGDSFTSISNKSSNLETANKNIEDIKNQIELVEEKLKEGVITADEAQKEFSRLLDELNTAVQSKIGAINEYMIGAFGENGPWAKAWEDAGYNASEAVGKTLGLTSDMQKKFNELTKKLAKTDPTSPKWKELQTQLYGVIGETNGLETALNNFQYNISALEVDYSGLITKDGELNEEEVKKAMGEISDAVKTANKDIETAGSELHKQLTEMISKADMEGNQEAVDYFSKMLDQLPTVISTQKSQVAAEAKGITDVLQTGLVENIQKIATDSYKAWDKMTEKPKGFTNATDYSTGMVKEYVNNVIKPFSESVENEFGTLGVKGAGWSSASAKEIANGFLNYDYYSIQEPTQEKIFGAWKGIITTVENKTEDWTKKSFKEIGKNGIVAGLSEGIDSKEIEKIGNKYMAKPLMGGFQSKLEINSPSKKFKEFGKYIVEGLRSGIMGIWSNFSTFWTGKHNDIINKFKDMKSSFTSKGVDIMSGIKSGISTQWSDFNTFWTGKKDSMISKFDGIDNKFSPKGKKMLTGIKGGISGEWGTFNTFWTGKKDSMISKFDSIYGIFEGKGNSIVGGLQDGISRKWGAFSSFFSDKIKGLVNGVIHGVNWVLEKVGSKTRLNEWQGFARGSKGIPKDTVGMVNDQKGSVYRELILPPDGKPFIPKGRNVMLPLKKGTKIMPAFETKKFMKNMPHFAVGIGDFFGSAWAKIQEFTGNIMDYITNPGKILQIALDKFVSLSSIAEPILSIAKGTVNTILGGATDFIQKMFDEELVVKYDPSKGVEQWRGLASKALQMTHQFTESNLNALLNQMRTESSGNPRAINLWDANARKGTPSKGLMQVIDPTFRAYAYPGFDKDIWDPLSNMLASIRYALARYGSLAKAYQGHAYKLGIGKIQYSDIIQGYATGGYPRKGDLFLANENGNPEMVGRMGRHAAVANNSQIAEGFAEAIYPAVYNAVSSAMRNNKNSTNVTFEVEGDPNGLFRVTRKKAREYYDRTKNQAFEF